MISQPVYHYRVREGGDLSITQRRAEKRALLDRLRAVELARDYLAEHGPRHAHRWYEDSVVAEDLRYHLNVLEVADDEYRELFVERVNAFLDRIGRRNVLKPLPAIDRLKYHLVRRRLMPELLEVLRFQREDMADAAPVQVRGRWYGDYPYRTDKAMGIPSWIYRLNTELALTAQVDELWWEGELLHISRLRVHQGHRRRREGAQRVTVLVGRHRRLRRLRRAAPDPLRRKAMSTARRDEQRATGLHDVSWSGFEATLPVAPLRFLRRWRRRVRRLHQRRAGGIRAGACALLDPASRPRADSVALADGTLVRAGPRPRARSRSAWPGTGPP